MRPFLKERSLFQQFVIFFVSMIITPIIVIGAISYYRSTWQIENVMSDMLTQVVIGISNQFDFVINEISWLTLQMADKAEIKQFIDYGQENDYQVYVLYNWIRNEVLLDGIYMRAPVISSISVLGDNGILYTDRNTSQKDTVYYMDNDEIRSKVDIFKNKLPPNGALGVFTIKTKPGTKGLSSSEKEFIYFGRRIYPVSSMVAKGTIIISIQADFINKLWADKDLKNGSIWVIDDNDQILYNPDKSMIGTKLSATLKNTLDSKGKKIFKTTWDGKEQYVICNTSQSTGWKVIAAIPPGYVKQPVLELRNGIIYILLFTFCITIMIGLLFIQSITKPIHKLENVMKGIGIENWKKIEGDIPKNEIGNLILVYNHMIQKISDLIDKVYKHELSRKKLELARNKAEFQALQCQINPHFLYNTLSTINTYAIMAEDTSIQDMIEALGSMLRYSVQNPFELVKLHNEIEHVKNYIFIQSRRQKMIPKIKWNVDNYLEYTVLRLTLQPLIENIFQHAYPKGIKPDSLVMISALEEGEYFILEVSDNGVGISWDQDEGAFYNRPQTKSGIGLSNVQRRLQIAFGDKYGIKLVNTHGNGTKVRILIPSDKPSIDIYT